MQQKTENKTDLIRIAGTIESEVLTNFDVVVALLVRIEYPTQAMFNLSNLYFSRKLGEKKQGEGLKWSEKAANTGDKDAQFSLGLRYANSDGVAQNHAKEIEWYKKAAKQEHAGAVNNLGFLKEKGYPVDLVSVGSQTLFRVKEIYKKACELSNQIACDNYINNRDPF